MAKIVRKFKFGDLALAEKVRGNMWNALIAFDKNENLVFEED
jgi:nitrous oxidase accessory protein NosD